MATTQSLAPNDWLEHPELLPPRPQTQTEAKFTRHFAVDINGRSCHDQYVFLSPNGLAVVGLAPSHPLIAAHRRATSYTPISLQYIPPKLDHLKAEELSAVAGDEDAQEDADAAAAQLPGGAAGVTPAEPPETADQEPEEGAAAGGGVSAEGPQVKDQAKQGAPQAAGPAGRPGGTPRPPPDTPDPEPFLPGECARVNFEAGAARNIAGAKTNGKKRGRSQEGRMRGTYVLAQVERRGGGDSFPVYFVLNGQLLETNERLAKNPRLLYDRPCREGYLAILSPTPEALNHLRAKLLSEADYLRLRGLKPEDLL